MDARACYKMLMRGVPSSKKVHPPKRKPDEPVKRKFEENESKADDKIKKLKTEPECKEDSSSDDSSDEEQDVKLMTDVKIVEEEPKQPTKEELAQALLEKVKEIRRRNRIFFDGTDMPVPVETFEQLVDTYKLNTNIMKNISNKLEYKTPTPIQMQSIPAMMQRRELLACAPTGSGKTAAFLIPLLQHLKEPARQGFRAVIVEPTKELARQVFWECNRLADGHGFRVKLIDDVKRSCKNSKQKPSDKVDILITTPQRLIHLLIKEDGPALSLKNVEWLIVDEADKLFELGAEKKNFRQQLGNIYSACDGNKVRRAFFSATYTAEVEDWCKTNLDNLLCVYIGDKNSAVDTVKQELKYTGWDAGKMFEMKNIFNKGIDLPALVFVDSKERAKMLFRELIVLYPDKRINVIHSDLTQQQREDVMKSFRAGKVWILITTELLCRGIDFKGVKLVINYDMPSSAISYVHRIGRTGRAGETGTAITFFGDDDKYGLGNIAEVMRDSGFEVPDFIFELPRSKHAVQKKKRKNTV